MVSDWKHILHAAGSTGTSAATAHLLFGNYQGLSLLAEEENVYLQIYASAQHLRVWNSIVTNNVGFRIEGNATADWPSMRAAGASLLHFARETATDASANWTLFRRLPY